MRRLSLLLCVLVAADASWWSWIGRRQRRGLVNAVPSPSVVPPPHIAHPFQPGIYNGQAYSRVGYITPGDLVCLPTECIFTQDIQITVSEVALTFGPTLSVETTCGNVTYHKRGELQTLRAVRGYDDASGLLKLSLPHSRDECVRVVYKPLDGGRAPLLTMIELGGATWDTEAVECDPATYDDLAAAWPAWAASPFCNGPHGLPFRASTVIATSLEEAVHG